MLVNVSVHLKEDTEVVARVHEKFVCLNFGEFGEPSIFFKSEEHLRSFAESILQQLEKKEEVSAS